MPPDWTRAQLRRAFTRWGLPRRIRVDNGIPWGSRGDLPTDLALWLLGLGVEVVWNPPGCPQANGVVERSQGTGKRWAEPRTCRDADQLQRNIDAMDRIQRELYPGPAGCSRTEAHPGLAHSGRVYEPDTESSQWDIERVWAHLAGYVAVRRVDRSGMISLYNRNHYVNTALAGRIVYITLDPVARGWVIAGRDGACYGRRGAEEFAVERIQGLSVSHRRDRNRHGTARRTPMSESAAQPRGG